MANIIHGADRADVLSGTDADDIIWGYADNDRIISYGSMFSPGNYDGDGFDVVYGNQGIDMIFAGREDTVFGGQGGDHIEGGIEVYGQLGDDTINANDDSPSFIHAGQGDDQITSFGTGDHTLAGGLGNDTIALGDGSETIHKGFMAGNDVIMHFDPTRDVILLHPGVTITSVAHDPTNNWFNNALVRFSDGSSLTFLNYDPVSPQADWFIVG